MTSACSHVASMKRLDEAAVDEDDAGGNLGVVGGELNSDACAPGMPDDHGAFEAKRLDEACEIAGYFGEGVRAGLVAEPVAALVERERAEALGEQRRRQVPDAAGRGEAVEEDEGAAGAAPIAVVEANARAVRRSM